MTKNDNSHIDYIVDDLQSLAVPIDSVLPDPDNTMLHESTDLVQIAASLRKYGQRKPIVVNKTGNVIEAGNGTWTAAKQILNWEYIAVVFVEDDPHTATGYAIADNVTGRIAQFAWEMLHEKLSQFDAPTDVPGVTDDFFAQVQEHIETEPVDDLDFDEPPRGSLQDRFIIPPFSVFDTRQGYWQNRKRAWYSLGITVGEARENTEAMGSFSGTVPGYYDKKRETEKRIGRKLSNKEFEEQYLPEYLNDDSMITRTNTGGLLSQFDPVLAEILYRWFSPPGGHIINPTAGEAVYGIVAGYLGYTYEGVEIRIEQVEANRENAERIGVADTVKWVHGDGRDTAKLIQHDADFIINCPPYYDLEIYSDDPADLSTLGTYDEFIRDYAVIVASAASRLKNNRFCAIVVGDVRDRKTGLYQNFVSDTIRVAHKAGMRLYNEAILLTQPGSLPIRVGRMFGSARKLGKTHQNVLIFVKGDWRKAVEACGDVEVQIPEEFANAIDGQIPPTGA